MKRKTRDDVITETLACGYTSSNRGKSNVNHTCYYINPHSGVMCAVGRCCEAPQADWDGPWSLLYVGSRQLSYEEREQLLMPAYRGLGTFFWMDLQGFHDDDNNWCSTGVSETGLLRAEELRRKWCNDSPSN